MKIATSNFLQKFRTLLISVVAAGILVVVGLAVWTQVDQAIKSNYATKINHAQKDFDAWKLEADEAKKAALGANLEKELGQIEKEAPHGYGLTKAWFLNGSYFAEQKKWTDAAKAFQQAAESTGSHDLGPISLVNEGVCLEEAGDLQGALKVYASFERLYSKDSLLSPQVLFAQGHLLEMIGKNKDAVSAYQKLLDQFPDSTWTKLGHDRILVLNS